MSAETETLATTPHPLGRPGGPGLFRDRSLMLPPYIQNLAHTFMTKRGMDKSRAIAMAIGAVQRWARGGGNVSPEVRAAAAAALATWEAAKAKADATPNRESRFSRPAGNPPEEKGVPVVTVTHAPPYTGPSRPMAFLRTVLDGSTAVELATPSLSPKAREKAAQEHLAEPDGSYPIRNLAELKKAVEAFGRAKDPEATKRWIIYRARQLKALGKLPQTWDVPKAPVQVSLNLAQPAASSTSAQKQYTGTSKLPPGAVRFKHGWQPVDASGKPVGPPLKPGSQELKDMAGHDQGTKDAIAQAYKNKQAASAAKAAKQGAAKSKAGAAASKKAVKAKAAAQKKQSVAAARAAQKQAAAKTRAHQQLISQAVKQAQADKKAGRPLTPSQVKILDAYNKQQAVQAAMLRNVSLAQPVELAVSPEFSGDGGYTTVPAVSSQDGYRATVNKLLKQAPKNKVMAAAERVRSKRRKGRGKGRK